MLRQKGGHLDYQLLVRQKRKQLTRSIDATSDLLIDLSLFPVIGERVLSAVNGDTREERSGQLLAFLLSLPDSQQDAAFGAFLSTLREHDQEHVANLINRESDRLPLSDEHYHRLLEKQGELEKFLDTECTLMDELTTRRIFSDADARRIRTIRNVQARSREIVGSMFVKSEDAYREFLAALRATNQGHVAYLLTGEGSPPMSVEHRTLLEQKAKQLRQFLDPTCGLLEELSDVFNHNDRLNVMRHRTPNDMALQIVDTLMRKPDRAFDRLMTALRSTGQGHVIYILTGEGDPPLSDECADGIRRNRDELVECIDSVHTSLIDKLVSRTVLNDVDRQRVRAERCCAERNGVLLELIARKSQAAYDEFVRTLGDLDQGHAVLTLEGDRISGNVSLEFASETQSSNRKSVERSLVGDLLRRKKEVNEKLEQKENGLYVVSVDTGSILLGIRCANEESLSRLRELLTTGELDALLTEMFCPLYASQGLKSVRIVVPDEELERSRAVFERLSPMSPEHRRLLEDASQSLPERMTVTHELLGKLGLCSRSREAIDAAETNEEKVRTLLAILRHRPDSVFGQFVDALKETGQVEAAMSLDPLLSASSTCYFRVDRTSSQSTELRSSFQKSSSGSRIIASSQEGSLTGFSFVKTITPDRQPEIRPSRFAIPEEIANDVKRQGSRFVKTPTEGDATVMPTVDVEKLEKMLAAYNEYYSGVPRLRVSATEVNGTLILEGQLRIHWGTRQPIRFKQIDESPDSPQLRHTSYSSNISSYATDECSWEKADDLLSQAYLTEGNNNVFGYSGNPEPGNRVIMRKFTKRQKIFKKLSYINGHIYNGETCVFVPPYGSVTSVAVTSLDTSSKVIRLLLDKFKVENSPEEYCLCVVRSSGEATSLSDLDLPLVERLQLGPLEDEAKIFIVERQQFIDVTKEVAQFANLPDAVLHGFLEKCNRDEKDGIRLITEKYNALREVLRQQLLRLTPSS